MVHSTPAKFEFRPAMLSDCRKIAELYSLSSDGVADYIWAKKAETGEDIVDVGKRRYEQEDSAFSYKNVVVVTNKNEVIGMLVTFPMTVEKAVDHQEEDPVLVPYSKLEEDGSYYICGVALFPEYRGYGIGSKLMEIAEEQAKEKGYNKLSLIVFEQNTGARKLYEKVGYREVAREPVVPHDLIHYDGYAILMVKSI